MAANLLVPGQGLQLHQGHQIWPEVLGRQIWWMHNFIGIYQILTQL